METNHSISTPISSDSSLPMIAWIMPVYNGEKYINQAIDSILLQPCKDCEVWVVDDGSTDSTAQIVKAIPDDRVHYIYQENAGVSAARNNGIRSSCSKFIAFLDADDVMCKDAYNEDIHRILEDGKYDILSFAHYQGDQNLKRGRLKPTHPAIILCENIHSFFFREIPSFLYQRSLVEGELSASFPEVCRCSEDRAFHFIAFYKARTLLVMERAWFIYRDNACSAMHQFLSSWDYLLNEDIHAWYWCKGQFTDKDARDECDAQLFDVVSDYIRLSCMNGVPVNTIQKALSAAPIQETLENYDALRQGNKYVYEAFITDPKAFRKSMLKKFWAYSLPRKAARLPGFRQIYMRIKYKEDIRAYLYS